MSTQFELDTREPQIDAPRNTEPPQYHAIAAHFEMALDACQFHAAKCSQCHSYLLDEDGNPQHSAHTCQRGMRLYRRYSALSIELTAIMEEA